MAKKNSSDSKKSVKTANKQEFKKIITEKLHAAFQDIRDHWSPKKFESRLKKAVKLFSDGKPPSKKNTKKKVSDNTSEEKTITG